MKNRAKILLIFIILLFAPTCKKSDPYPYMDTLKALYKIYKNGEIDECKLNNNVVFSAASNYVDAAVAVFDNTGKVIGECDFAWGPIDSICHQIINCQVIYRCKNDISGEPPVNKYNLRD